MTEPLAPTVELDVEFGDTDPAALVYYPNYFKWYDAGTWRLFLGAGLTLEVLREEFGIWGFPAVEARSSFRRAVRFCDHLSVYSRIVKWGRSSMVIAHEIKVDEQLCAQGQEVRVLCRHKEDGRSIESVPIPEVIRQRLSERVS